MNPGITDDMHDRIKVAREYAGLKPIDLARRVGVAASSAHNWEVKTFPDVGNLAKIALITGCCFEWLATGRGPMHYVEGGAARESPPAYAPLSPDQQQLLDLYLALKPAKRSALIDFLHAWR